MIAHPVLLLLAGAVLWTAAMTAAPLLPSGISGLLYAGAGIVCHQIPNRSFHLATGSLAVCARCFGLYLGAAIGFGVIAVRRHRILRFTPALALLAASAAPTAATLIAEWLLAWPVGNRARSLAALPLGLALAMTIGAAVAADFRRARAGTEMVG